MNILHIPSWFPSRAIPLSGIFIKKHIDSFGLLKDTTHVVLNWHDTEFARLNEPFKFLKAYRQSRQPYLIRDHGSVINVSYKLFHSHKSIFGDFFKSLLVKTTPLAKDLHKNFEFKLIHSHVTFPGGFLAMHLSSSLGIPYIISEHMSPFPFETYKQDKAKLKSCIIEPLSKSKVVVAVSEAQKKEITGFGGRSVVVIPNVVDENEFTYPYPSPGNREFIFLNISLISYQKGIDILLHAVKILAQKGISQFKLIIGGDGELLGPLRELARNLKIDHLVEWAGRLNRPEVVRQMQNCNCYVLSSRHESFGVSLVEALSCGKPVIATRCGGPEDIVNNNNGLLVENENAGELASAMEFMIKKANTYIPGLIRQDYMDKYSTKVVAARYRELYGQVTAKKEQICVA